MQSRSYEPIASEDLDRLSAIAAADRADLFERKPDTGRLYADRLFAVALCQGGALHFIDRVNGVKDLDVWSFYVERPERPFPYRRRGKADFGDPKFGQSDDRPGFVGRRVDLIGRSLVNVNPSRPIDALQHYLRAGGTPSARFLAKKAVVMLDPRELRGTVIWPECDTNNANSAKGLNHARC